MYKHMKAFREMTEAFRRETQPDTVVFLLYEPRDHNSTSIS